MYFKLMNTIKCTPYHHQMYTISQIKNTYFSSLHSLIKPISYDPFYHIQPALRKYIAWMPEFPTVLLFEVSPSLRALHICVCACSVNDRTGLITTLSQYQLWMLHLGISHFVRVDRLKIYYDNYNCYYYYYHYTSGLQPLNKEVYKLQM